MLTGIRDGLIARRTQLSNAIRGSAAEFGLIAPKGLDKIEPLLARIAKDENLQALARELFASGSSMPAAVELEEIGGRLLAWHRRSLGRRLAQIHHWVRSLRRAGDEDPIRRSAPAALCRWMASPPRPFHCRQDQAGKITRAGDEDLRRLLVIGATAVIQQASRGRGHHSRWLLALIQRKPPKLAAVALANKVARIAWKLMVTGESYDAARMNATAAVAA